MLALVVLMAILVPAGPLGADRSWSEAMHDIETPLLTHLALVFNWLGRGLGRAIGLTLVGLLLLRRRRWLALAAFAVAESLAPLCSALLKALTDRPRPPDGLVHAAGTSFPSGHATYAGATCLALVLLFTTPGTRRRWWWALAGLGVVGMAWSRTYLQVHWLTDVIAGALLGSGISLLVFAIAQLHQSRVIDGVLMAERTGLSTRESDRKQLQDAATPSRSDRRTVPRTSNGRREAIASLRFHWFPPRPASVERERSALRAAPGIASALCGSVSCFSEDVNRRLWRAHNPKLRYGASRARAPRSGGRARR
jgi:undecaprenyl-diphosphatase